MPGEINKTEKDHDLNFSESMTSVSYLMKQRSSSMFDVLTHVCISPSKGILFILHQWKFFVENVIFALLTKMKTFLVFFSGG